MKRDMELVRALLFNTEVEGQVDLSKWSEGEQLYHLDIMIEANLLKGTTRQSENGDIALAVIQRLTWDGHEFLDSVRSDTIWKKTKGELAKFGSSVSFSVLSHLVVSIANAQLGLA
jgi:hypothetical protein